MSGLVDARGCLTEDGLAALASASPGAAPPDLAQHLASCARCQDLWLKSAALTAVRPRITPEDTARRRWGMLAVVVGVLLFALISLVVTLSWLSR